MEGRAFLIAPEFQNLDVDSPLTVSTIEEILVTLEQRLEQSKTQILTVVAGHQAEFINTLTGLENFIGQVQVIGLRLGDVDSRLKKGELENEIRKSGLSLQEARQRLTCLEKLQQFIASLLSLKELEKEFDAGLRKLAFGEAATILRSMAESLKAFSGKNPADDPSLVHTLKMGYVKRLSVLRCRLDGVLTAVLHSTPKSFFLDLAALPKTGDRGECLSLDDIWAILQDLGILRDKLREVSAKIREDVLEPLFSQLKQIHDSSGYRDDSVTSSSSSTGLCFNCTSVLRDSGYRTWMWSCHAMASEASTTSPNLGRLPISADTRSEQQKDPEFSVTVEAKATDGPLALHRVAVAVLTSFFGFLERYVFSSSTCAFNVLGRQLWNYICDELLKRMPLCKEAVPLLSSFQVTVSATGLITQDDQRLEKELIRFQETMQDQRNSRILEEARRLMLSDELKKVPVSDESEIGSLTNLAKAGGADLGNNSKVGKKGKNAGSSGNSNSERRNNAFWQSAIDDSDGFLRLAPCTVCESTHMLVKQVHSVLEDAVKSTAEKEPLSVATAFQLLARRLVVMFISVRPTHHKERLLSDPVFGGFFFSDCAYLMHHLVTIPFTYSSRLYQPFDRMLSFMDMVSVIRRMQESYFVELLKGQKNKLLEILDGTEGMKGVGSDRCYATVETAIGSCLSLLKYTSHAWLGILPVLAYMDALGVLIDCFLNAIVHQVLSIGMMKARDSAALAHLLATISASLNPLFSLHCDFEHYVNSSRRQAATATGDSCSGRLVPSLDDRLEHLRRFELLRDYIEADFSQLYEKRQSLQKAFTKKELYQFVDLCVYVTRPTKDAHQRLCEE